MRLLWLSVPIFVIAVTPAAARLNASDAHATHAYLEARVHLKHADAALGNKPLHAIEALAAEAEADCPDVLAGAPSHATGEPINESQIDISQELISGSLLAGEHFNTPSLASFQRRVSRLRWSSRRLTTLLHSLALEQDEQSAIVLPNLCADLKYWVASGYKQVSSGTKRFLHRLSVISSITQIEFEPPVTGAEFFDTEALVARRLRPYEDREDRSLARKVFRKPDAQRHEAASKVIVEAFEKVLKAVGRAPAPVTTQPLL